MLATLLLGLPAPIAPHDGPPYPILVDERVGPYVVSVWADPDVGVGTFYVMLDPPPGDSLPAGTSVRVLVQPVDGELPESAWTAEAARRSGGEQYNAEVDFPTEERWRARFVLDGERGGGEIATEVDVTPPGLGRLDLLWYAAPFALVALLWTRGLLKAKARTRARAT